VTLVVLLSLLQVHHVLLLLLHGLPAGYELGQLHHAIAADADLLTHSMPGISSTPVACCS
jgi:hypothetical protein